MSKPDDIPQDVWNSAIKCAEIVCRNLDYDDVTIEVIAIARAIMAEREACAFVVDAECERVLSKQDGRDAAIDHNLRMIAVLLPSISDAIRKRGEG